MLIIGCRLPLGIVGLAAEDDGPDAIKLKAGPNEGVGG